MRLRALVMVLLPEVIRYRYTGAFLAWVSESAAFDANSPACRRGRGRGAAHAVKAGAHCMQAH
jgi:hypothetical protein